MHLQVMVPEKLIRKDLNSWLCTNWTSTRMVCMNGYLFIKLVVNIHMDCAQKD